MEERRIGYGIWVTKPVYKLPLQRLRRKWSKIILYLRKYCVKIAVD
jgi:hypothetical protein